MKTKKSNLILLFILILCFVFPIAGNYTNFIVQDTQEDISNNPITSDVIVGSYTIPGISASIPLSQVIKIGILNDMNELPGDHSWNGAFLAAKEINEAGGVLINGTYFYVGLVAEDTDEVDPNLVVSKGVIAAQTMVNSHDPHFIIGGYRTEALLAYQEVVMDAKIPFISTGAPSEILCENVRSFYTRYKYFFRIIPLNASSSTIELLYYYAGLVAYLNATYDFSSIKFGILHENLAWSTNIVSALNFYIPMIIPGSSIVNTIAFDITLSQADMFSHLVSLEASGAQIVIPLISGPSGILMGTQYGILKPQYLLAGINRYASHGSYWDLTHGGGQYEIIIQNVYKTNKSELTIPFWDSYVALFGSEPFYTGTGSFDAVKLLVNSTIETQSFNPDKIIENLEKIDSSNPFTGASGKIAFYNTHDLKRGYPYGYDLFCQWQIDGNKEIVSSLGTIYPESMVTGSLSIPYWGIDGIVGDFSHKLPGDFILDSDADDPDTDGAFNLNWTASNGADYYSLYRSDEPITYVSKTHTLLLSNNSVSPYPISGLKSGEYYFAVVSYNETGQKFSNNLHITVQLPPPGNFILSSLADDPDTNGEFYLSWTDSDRAENYSVYTYNKSISEINGSLISLAYQTALSPFSVTQLSNGKFYYVVVAYNEEGQTMSNNVHVTIQIPETGNGDTTAIPGYNLFFLLGILSVVVILISKKKRNPKI